VNLYVGRVDPVLVLLNKQVVVHLLEGEPGLLLLLVILLAVGTEAIEDPHELILRKFKSQQH